MEINTYITVVVLMSLIILLIIYTLISFDRIVLCRWVPLTVWYKTVFDLLESAAKDLDLKLLDFLLILTLWRETKL